MHYFGTRLSENISRREPEGYLICLNVPVARSGTQQYLPEELGLENSQISGGHETNLPQLSGTSQPPTCHSERSRGISLITVKRPSSEVFSPATIASFEGMPVTNDHPPDGVDIDNIHFLQMGHAHNIRRGTGDESDLLLADLIITDPHLIDLILAGKREISCGYTYELCEENGQYIQRRIRGNHIAVVDAGRAGPRVSIKDHKHERSKKPPMKKSLTKLLARMAKDGDVETVAEFIEEMIEEKENTPEEVLESSPDSVSENSASGEPVTVEVPENREITIDNDLLNGILERLDKLIALFTPLNPVSADDDPAEEISEIVEEVLEAAGEPENKAPEDPAEQISEMVETILEPVVSTTLEENNDECGDPDPMESKDTLRAVLKAVRPALARMTPAQRRKVCGDIASNMRKARKTGDSRIYASLASTRKPAPNLSALGQKIMEKRNPCYRK